MYFYTFNVYLVSFVFAKCKREKNCSISFIGDYCCVKNTDFGEYLSFFPTISYICKCINSVFISLDASQILFIYKFIYGMHQVISPFTFCCSSFMSFYASISKCKHNCTYNNNQIELFSLCPSCSMVTMIVKNVQP